MVAACDTTNPAGKPRTDEVQELPANTSQAVSVERTGSCAEREAAKMVTATRAWKVRMGG
jgi:hypothetical protein